MGSAGSLVNFSDGTAATKFTIQIDLFASIEFTVYFCDRVEVLLRFLSLIRDKVISKTDISAQKHRQKFFMENIYGGDGGSGARAPKLKSLTGNVTPPTLSPQNLIGRSFWHRHHHLHSPKTSILDPYASSDSCSDFSSQDSPLIRYLTSSSGSGIGSSSRSRGGKSLSPLPLSSIENFEMTPPRSKPAFNFPVKIEEDVIVMDGILVDSGEIRAPKSNSGPRMKSTLTSPDTGGRLLPSMPSPLTTGKENNNFYKKENCRSNEEIISNRFGPKCQVAHGWEEVRSSRFINKTKLEAQPCQLFIAGVCPYGSKCRYLHTNQVNEVLPSLEASTPSKVLPSMEASSTPSKVLPAPTRKVSPINPEIRSDGGRSFGDNTPANKDWCPLDDGIKITRLPGLGDKTPSKEEVNARIKSVLHGPSVKKRLSVFTEFCPE
ncbi:OLC1v1002579C1 [Oldenlandia corymbosa var. corymbosa]|uniref:OLC1v1002579C1 n=1 Tax=Oldenlandia corymbosa var. corymbosa TaxID=529605 RepID=A0AAV1D805_OLDCO|nr:OLC1v1002579C1 [Oldenlandia corymbosa var. corymbosa]